jgi:hypothetical protein
MLPDRERNTAPRHGLKEHAGSQDSGANPMSRVSLSEDSEQPQSEAIRTVLDEMQGTASRRCAPSIKPDS